MALNLEANISTPGGAVGKPHPEDDKARLDLAIQTHQRRFDQRRKMDQIADLEQLSKTSVRGR